MIYTKMNISWYMGIYIYGIAPNDIYGDRWCKMGLCYTTLCVYYPLLLGIVIVHSSRIAWSLYMLGLLRNPILWGIMTIQHRESYQATSTLGWDIFHSSQGCSSWGTLLLTCLCVSAHWRSRQRWRGSRSKRKKWKTKFRPKRRKRRRRRPPCHPCHTLSFAISEFLRNGCPDLAEERKDRRERLEVSMVWPCFTCECAWISLPTILLGCGEWSGSPFHLMVHHICHWTIFSVYFPWSQSHVMLLVTHRNTCPLNYLHYSPAVVGFYTYHLRPFIEDFPQ